MIYGLCSVRNSQKITQFFGGNYFYIANIFIYLVSITYLITLQKKDKWGQTQEKHDARASTN